MAIRPFNFYVEMEKNDYTPVGEVKQLDTMELDIKVLENSIPKNLESSEISLYVRKKDGTILEQKENISIVEASEGTIKIKVKNQATACAGMTLFELELKGADGIATTGTFIFVVNERVVNGEVVESKDEIHALVEVEKYVKLAKEELQRFKELQAEMLRTNETMNFQENLRNVAETERISAEEERKEKESERVENEGNRVTAEGLRANAESSRANAENSRERKERERVTAEVSRVDAEALRVSEEKKRVNAENSRANSERSRIDAESVRVAEEKKRVTAETARAENEDARVLAERNREENFSQFESKINKISSDMSKNTKELKNARTATTGEEFNSLDERIDCEVERLSKKIEVSFLQQEDKENHVIENTVDGMTNDMVVKGKTLQNLIKDGRGTFTIDKSINEYSRIKAFKTTLPLKVGKEYTGYLVVDNLENSERWLSIYGYKKDETTASIYGNVRKKNDLGVVKFTWTPNNGNIDTFDTIGIYIESTDFNNGAKATFSDFMLFEEGTDLTNIDKYFEGIKSFGQEEGKIVELSHGENLFNIEKILLDESTFVEYEGGFATNKNINSYSIISDLLNIKFKENTQYTLKYTHKILTPDIGYNFIIIKYTDGTDQNIYLNNTDVVANTQSGKTVKSIGVSYNKGGARSAFINFSIVEGLGTDYEPYKEDRKEIQLSKYGFEEGLRGLNNSVYDELNSIRDVAVKRIDKNILDGDNEDWIVWANSTGDTVNAYVYFNRMTPNLKDIVKPNSICINDRLPSNQGGYLSVKEGFKITSEYFALSIHKSKLGVENVNDSNNATLLKNWLKQNPITVYYELAEPVETPLTDPINVKTFNEKTYVSFLNSLKGTCNFKAPVDTVLALSNLTDDIKNKTDKKEADEINERATESLELSEYNHSDINDNIFPYLMDLELMVLDMMELNGYTNKKYKISERAGIHMTSKQALERLIRQKKVTLEGALDRIVRYNDAGRITDAEALELTDLAHEIL